MPELPQPATVVEMYLAAILAELQAIRREIRFEPNHSAESESDGGEVDLKEPKQTTRRPKSK